MLWVKREMAVIDLANRLKYWRERAVLSPVELARKIDVHPSAVSHWEAGRSFPGALKLIRIAEACGASMRQFWGPMPGAKR